MKPKVLLITDIPFWQSGAGHIARLRALMEFILTHGWLTIIFLGNRRNMYLDERLPPGTDLICLPDDNLVDRTANIKLIRKLLSFETYKLCIIEYIQQSYFLKGIPDGVITVLDAHDIISKRNRSFASLNYPNLDIDLTKEREYTLYQCYDYVMFLSENDVAESVDLLGRDRIILAPHPVDVFPRKLRIRAQIVGFIGSNYLPNIDAITWFIEQVWPLIPKQLELELHVFGTVCGRLPKTLSNESRIVMRGFVHDLNKIYGSTDIMVNPVRMGAGIKIKNIEALANGIPLITTTHGSSGLEEKAGTAYLVADKAVDFAIAIAGLASNARQRKSLAYASREWVASRFSEERCFTELKGILLE